MRTADFDYELPADRIAQTPAEPRDSARLLVVHRASGRLEHSTFADLGQFLRPGDLLVANDSRVLSARLHARKLDTAGHVEVLLLRPLDERTWQTLVRGKVRAGTRLVFNSPAADDLHGTIISVSEAGERVLRFDGHPARLIAAAGTVPLPPYIHAPLADPERYQTVYAAAPGSAAAPTAGLHFTPSLMTTLAAHGIRFAFVTLHIGLDTFRPITTEDVAMHPIHREWGALPAATAGAITATRAAGGRVVAVGTTAVRVLEAAAASGDSAEMVAPYSGDIDLFITPGYCFRAVDALITNFHLPRSTLLLLVAAFMGKPLMDTTYRTAIAEGYRFYSFGDATLVL